MNIKRIFITLGSKEPVLHFIRWNLLFYAVFLIGSATFHFYKQGTQKAQTYQSTKKRLQNQLNHIETLLAFVDNRLSHSTTNEMQKRILQDRYSDSIGEESYPKILNIYHIQNIQTGAATCAYGKITLEQLPPPSFFETQLDSNHKISITVDEKYFNIFSPRSTSLTNHDLPSFLMLKVPLEELLSQGVSLSGSTQEASRLDLPGYNITFFLNIPERNFISDYINVFWPYYLLMLMFTCLFSLYLARTRKEAEAKIFKSKVTPMD